jgi:hypothetical protein
VHFVNSVSADQQASGTTMELVPSEDLERELEQELGELNDRLKSRTVTGTSQSFTHLGLAGETHVLAEKAALDEKPMIPMSASCQSLGKPGKHPIKRGGVAQSAESLISTPGRMRQVPTPHAAVPVSAAIDFHELQTLHGIQDTARSDSTLLASQSERSVGSHNSAMSTAASTTTESWWKDPMHKACITNQPPKNAGRLSTCPSTDRVTSWDLVAPPPKNAVVEDIPIPEENTLADRVASSLATQPEDIKQHASRELPGYLKPTQSFQTQADTTRRMSEQRASIVSMAPAFVPSEQKVQSRKHHHGTCRSVSPSSNRAVPSETQWDVKQILQNPQAEYFAPCPVPQPKGNLRRAKSVPLFNDDAPARCVVESWKLNDVCLQDSKWKRAFLEFAGSKIVGKNVGAVSQMPSAMTALRWSVAKKVEWKNLLVNDNESDPLKTNICLANAQEGSLHGWADKKNEAAYSSGPLNGSSSDKKTHEASADDTSTRSRSPCPTAADHQAKKGDHVEAQLEQLQHLAVKEEMEEMMRLFQTSSSAQMEHQPGRQQDQKQQQPHPQQQQQKQDMKQRLHEWRQKRQEQKELQQQQQPQQSQLQEQQEHKESQEQPIQGVQKRRSIAELLEKRQNRDAEMEKLVEWRNSFRAAAKARASGTKGACNKGETDFRAKDDYLSKQSDLHGDSGSEPTTAPMPGSPRSSESSFCFAPPRR